ncbi:hypothetical protein NDU88_004018 [Pleurodeles waltl]|uniref:Uncharacterized protein n=1 Tax=Pleurodeles waltl TaxID=8319 RepID=A0AAV7LTH6_PLEWA|nr:hypothetical protein NDU88_004018 [Pleurodeles waltl]
MQRPPSVKDALRGRSKSPHMSSKGEEECPIICDTEGDEQNLRSEDDSGSPICIGGVCLMPRPLSSGQVIRDRSKSPHLSSEREELCPIQSHEEREKQLASSRNRSGSSRCKVGNSNRDRSRSPHLEYRVEEVCLNYDREEKDRKPPRARGRLGSSYCDREGYLQHRTPSPKVSVRGRSRTPSMGSKNKESCPKRGHESRDRQSRSRSRSRSPSYRGKCTSRQSSVSPKGAGRGRSRSPRRNCEVEDRCLQTSHRERDEQHEKDRGTPKKASCKREGSSRSPKRTGSDKSCSPHKDSEVMKRCLKLCQEEEETSGQQASANDSRCEKCLKQSDEDRANHPGMARHQPQKDKQQERAETELSSTLLYGTDSCPQHRPPSTWEAGRDRSRSPHQDCKEKGWEIASGHKEGGTQSMHLTDCPYQDVLRARHLQGGAEERAQSDQATCSFNYGQETFQQRCLSPQECARDRSRSPQRDLEVDERGLLNVSQDGRDWQHTWGRVKHQEYDEGINGYPRPQHAMSRMRRGAVEGRRRRCMEREMSGCINRMLLKLVNRLISDL